MPREPLALQCQVLLALAVDDTAPTGGVVEIFEIDREHASVRFADFEEKESHLDYLTVTLHYSHSDGLVFHTLNFKPESESWSGKLPSPVEHGATVVACAKATNTWVCFCCCVRVAQLIPSIDDSLLFPHVSPHTQSFFTDDSACVHIPVSGLLLSIHLLTAAFKHGMLQSHRMGRCSTRH